MPFITARVMSVIRDDSIAALADAGPNQSVLCASTVQLEGDIVGDDIANHTFEWEQTSGTPVTLINANTLTPSFINPQVSDLEFTLYLDRNTPFEDSDAVFISRAPESAYALTGGGTGVVSTNPVATPQSNRPGNNILLTNSTAHVSGWGFTNPPTARYSPIFKAEDLDRMRKDLTGSYWLMNDIDLSGYANWDPIGSAVKPFVGELQGNGFIIDNLTITDSVRNSGLFGTVDGATIASLGVTNANVTGQTSTWYSGILAGVLLANNASIISNCYTTGDIDSEGDRAGGFVGYTATNVGTTFTNTYADVTVTGGGTRTGGWAGFFETEAVYVENYGNTDKTALFVGSLGDTPVAGEVEGRTSDQLQIRSLYNEWNFVNTWDWPQPYFGNVVLQIGCEGADEAQVLTDASSYNHTITVNGSSVTDTDQFKVGSSSFRKGSIKDSVTRQGTEFDISPTESWTAEAWVRFSGDPGAGDTPFFAGPYHSPGNLNWLWRLNNNNMEFIMGSGTAQVGSTILAAWNPVGSQWYHIAVCLERGSTDFLRMFVDGTQIGSDSSALDGLGSNGNLTANFGLALGSYWNGAVNLSGWLDNIRIVTGEALYTENFTPSAQPYTTTLPGESSATLQRDRSYVREGGFCDDQWMILWDSPGIADHQYAPPKYAYKGATVEEKVNNGWGFSRFIPRERLGALMTPATTHRISSHWTLALDGTRLNPIGVIPLKDITVVNDKVFTSKETSPRFGPYGNSSMPLPAGGVGISAPASITIANPSKISMQQDDIGTLGAGGAVGVAAEFTILRTSGLNKTLGNDFDTVSGAGGAVALSLAPTIVRVNGASIG